MATRREFVAASAAAIGMTMPRGAWARAIAAGSAPDLVVLGASVYTVDDGLPRAEAFAVLGGRFLAVGTTEEIRKLAGPGTEVIDARGATVVPGLIDAHTHPDGVEELVGVNTNLPRIAESGLPAAPNSPCASAAATTIVSRGVGSRYRRTLGSPALLPVHLFERGDQVGEGRVVDPAAALGRLRQASPPILTEMRYRATPPDWFRLLARGGWSQVVTADHAVLGVRRITRAPTLRRPGGNRPPPGCSPGGTAKHAPSLYPVASGLG